MKQDRERIEDGLLKSKKLGFAKDERERERGFRTRSDGFRERERERARRRRRSNGDNVRTGNTGRNPECPVSQ